MPNFNCDKCGKPVEDKDNAALLNDMVHETNYAEFTARHFLPVYDGETMVCMGSPSRSQYIEGQPRDDPYIQEEEQAWRDAYQQVQG